MTTTRLSRALLVALASALYVATWPLGHGSFFSDLYAVAAFGPLLLAAWTFGLRGATVSVLVFFLLQGGLFVASGHEEGWDAFAGPEGAAAMGVMALVALFTGGAADSQRKMQRLVHSQADLVAVVSHEVRTPLTAVVGIARELKDGWSTLPEETRLELVGLVAESAEDMAAIVEDLLTAAKAEQGNLVIESSAADLSGIASSVVDQLRFGSSVHGQAVAWADPHRARQIIRNLVVNAARYGGPQVELQAGSNGSMVWIEVTDNGAGISPGQLEKLFSPYTANQDRQDSNGLGLALSRQLANLMDGDLSYRRVDGKTVFRFSLPKAVDSRGI